MSITYAILTKHKGEMNVCKKNKNGNRMAEIKIHEISGPDDLQRIIREVSGSEEIISRDRPYTGQPHTITGEEFGATPVTGLTIRDICDCVVKGLLLASTDSRLYNKVLEGKCCYEDVYSMPGDFDPIAAIQNAASEIRSMMDEPQTPIDLSPEPSMKYFAKIVVEFEAKDGAEAYAKAEDMGDLISVGINKDFVISEDEHGRRHTPCGESGTEWKHCQCTHCKRIQQSMGSHCPAPDEDRAPARGHL